MHNGVCLARVLLIQSDCSNTLSPCWLRVFLPLFGCSVQSNSTCEVGIELRSSVVSIRRKVLVCWTHRAWSVIDKQITSSCRENVGRIWIKAWKLISNPTARLLNWCNIIYVCLFNCRFDRARSWNTRGPWRDLILDESTGNNSAFLLELVIHHLTDLLSVIVGVALMWSTWFHWAVYSWLFISKLTGLRNCLHSVSFDQSLDVI